MFRKLLMPALLLAVGFGQGPAHGRDEGQYVNSPMKAWFESLRSKNGEQCCAEADGRFIADVDSESKDGHYRVRIEGEWVDVPEDRVITAPNLVGRTMVWPMYMDGHPIVRCFMPGSMT